MEVIHPESRHDAIAAPLALLLATCPAWLEKRRGIGYFPTPMTLPLRKLALLGAEILAVCSAMVFYVSFQRDAHVPAYQENDPDGYFWIAQRFARGESVVIPEKNPYQWQTHVWVEHEPGFITPKYPPGYPFALAAFMRLAGEDRAFYASTFFGLLTLPGCYWLFRLWLGPGLAIPALATLLFSPMFLAYSAYPLTHGLDLCLATWGYAFLWQGLRQKSALPFMLAALLLGLGVTVRPTNLILATLLPIAIWGSGLSPVAKLGTALAYLPGPFILFSYHWLVFGSPFTSGYSLSGEQDAFSLSSIPGHLAPFLSGLNEQGLPILFPLGLIGLLLWGTARDRLLRAFVALGVFVLYAAYYWPYCGMATLRFLLIAFPVLIGSAFGLFLCLRTTSPRLPYWLGYSLCVVAITVSSARGMRTGKTIRGWDGGTQLANAIRHCDAHLPDDAVIFSLPPLFCHIGAHRNYDFYDFRSFEPHFITRPTDPREPRMQPSRRERLIQLYETTSHADFARAMEAVINEALDAGREVAWLVPADQARGFRQRVSPAYHFTEVARWDEVFLFQSERRHHPRQWVILKLGRDA